MARLIDEYDIKHEIDNVYITLDGKRFILLEDAVKHQKNLKSKHYFKND